MPRRRSVSLKRLAPLLVLGSGFAIFFATGAHHYLNFEVLAEHRELLQGWVARHTAGAGFLYFFVYIAVIAFSVPGGLVLTALGGFLFGTWLAGSIVVFAATIGATILFLAARTGLADLLRARTGSALDKMETGFRENAMSYLLVLRLIPLFPFFLVNLVPAFVGVPLGTYVIATFFGIIPGTFVFASLGNGFGVLFATGESLDFSIIHHPEVIGPLLALAALACLPIVYKRYKSRR